MPKFGAREWNQTTDILVTSEVLYQLSYTGLKWFRVSHQGLNSISGILTDQLHH